MEDEVSILNNRFYYNRVNPDSGRVLIVGKKQYRYDSKGGVSDINSYLELIRSVLIK